jgi:TonB-dependent receptor
MIVSLLLNIFQATADEGTSQTGKLSGRIIDKTNGETLIGVPVMIEGTTIGGVTDLDGQFLLPGIPAGNHSVSIRYVGYQPMVIRDVAVRPGEVANLEVALETSSQELNEVMIVAELKRENIGALMVLQQKSATVQDGISAESIKRTPDRSTSEVVRRVSGASVQEGKFVIIRGLNDRYNAAMLNGVPLASTEPDRKAFSFDLFPANLLDNLIVVKTATPDLPGEFAGGLLQVNTRDIPDQRFFGFSAGTSYNSISTFKRYESYKGGKRDWTGFDDGTRALPAGFMDSETLKAASTGEKINASKSLQNDWMTEESSSQPMAHNYQFSFGNSKELGKDRFGFIGALTYSTAPRTAETERADFDFDGQQNFEYSDRQYRENVLWGALFNTTYKIGDRSKISFRNLFSVNANDQVIHRHGFDLENTQEIDAKALWYSSNVFFNSVLSGEHAINEKGLRVNWNLGYSTIFQNTPDLRRSLYYRDANAGAEDTGYYAYVPFGTASPNYAGKFYSTLDESNRFGESSVVIPLGKSGKNHSIKTGIFEQQKERAFDARVLGYVVTNASRFNWSYLQLPVGDLFTADHMGTDGFRIDEITNPSDRYTASSRLHAGYILSDNRLAEKSRIVWGVRVENFIQELNSFGYSNERIDVRTNVTDILPSMNYTYAAGEHTNIRVAASKTVARPEFRELAPFAFYDFVTATSVAGNADIKRSSISNFDLRWETFPAAGELLSASVFFKDFNDPIEPVVESSGAGSRRISFRNAERGTVFGIETEWRKKLDFLSRWITWNQLENFSIYGNLSLMKSRVDVSNDARSLGKRPMQGQSPYVMNAGFQYLESKSGFGCNIVFNRIGDRIFQVGNQGYLSILEAPRSVFDLQVSKRIFDKGELKLGISDLLNRPAVFYQDQNGNGKYDAGNDSRISNTVTGTTVSLSVAYKF